MMDIDKYFVYVLCFYYIAVLAWLVYSIIVKRRYKHRILYELLIIALLPLSGLLVLKMSLLFLKDNRVKKIDELENYSFNEEMMKTSTRAHKADSKREMDLVSIQDVLAFNSAREKRSVVMDLFSFDSEQYIRELQIALNDEDTEVSHYAAAALVDLKDRLSIKVIEARNSYEVDPSPENINNYLQILKRYIDCGILNKNMRRKNERLFCQIFEKASEGDFVDEIEWTPKYLEYMTNSGDAEKTLGKVKLFVEATRKEEAYLSALRAAYVLKRPEEFKFYLDSLRKEKIILSDENYDILQFFLKGDEDYEKK